MEKLFKNPLNYVQLVLPVLCRRCKVKDSRKGCSWKQAGREKAKERRTAVVVLQAEPPFPLIPDQHSSHQLPVASLLVVGLLGDLVVLAD